MGLIDTHTHLESFARKGSLDAVLDRAKAVGVTQIITIGTGPEDWPLYQSITRAHPEYVHYTVGLHPCSVDADWQRAVGQIERYWSAGELPVALGECGLDRFHLPQNPSEAERILAWQREAFSFQLQLAKRLGCPVVVHSRGAFAECVEMVDQSGVDWRKVVFHCFTEGEAEMTALLQRGGFGSFTGILTYKNADPLRAAAKLQGLERLMLETDAPYLTPVPHRGKPNEPAFVRDTAAFAADVFGVTLEQLSAATTASAAAFFQLRV